MANLNYNRVIIAGRLVADPEQRTTSNGNAVTSFRVAVNRRPTKNASADTPQSDFFTVVAWQGTAEFVTKYFHKGSSILVEGRLQERQWIDQQGQKRVSVEIVADNVYFVDSKSESPNATKNEHRENAQPMAAANATLASSDLPPVVTASQLKSANKPDGYKFVDVTNGDDLPF